MKTAIGTGLMLFLFGCLGCRPATPTAPGTEKYFVEANRSELVAGKKQNVDILVRYHRSQRPAAPLKFQVQLLAPRDLTITPDRWHVQQNLTSRDAGFNYTGLAVFEVAEDAEPGEREVAVTITPEDRVMTTARLKFQVIKKGD